MSKSKNDATNYAGNKYKVDTVPLDIAQLVQNDWTQQKPKEWPYGYDTQHLARSTSRYSATSSNR
ncbi:unnamed protein product [Gongylonema pulchrum]|uniref:Peptidoglycan glycosyltransferase n=1 Tax=Gongylonema pulchrum TaxID=637853 RepID=A0A183DBF8_9BILA|nr:unnamed protein product [Gongylonema pulchrum]